MTPGREIWVLANQDCDEQFQTSFGIIAEGKKIARDGDKLIVVVLGHSLENMEKFLEVCGADEAYLCDHPLLARYSTDGFNIALQQILKNKTPWLFLLADDAIGEDLAPRIAVNLNTGLASHCVKIEQDYNGTLTFSSPVYNGAFYSSLTFREGVPQVATISTRVLDKVTLKYGTKTRIINVQPNIELKDIRIQSMGLVPPEPGTVDITEADVVVAIGRGALDKELIASARDLSLLLGGSLGATRPVIDEKVLPIERLVGRTGKTVTPDVYIALGISGSMHHIAGITESKKILSINTDASAPITKYADENFVVPLQEVLPELVRRLKEARGKKK
jgi:electron transfer flavoprotein alpha subunit